VPTNLRCGKLPVAAFQLRAAFAHRLPARPIFLR